MTLVKQAGVWQETNNNKNIMGGGPQCVVCDAEDAAVPCVEKFTGVVRRGEEGRRTEGERGRWRGRGQTCTEPHVVGVSGKEEGRGRCEKEAAGKGWHDVTPISDTATIQGPSAREVKQWAVHVVMIIRLYSSACGFADT
jgi:hypothetical protein